MLFLHMIILLGSFCTRIRNLSNGASVSVPPPSPGPSSRLAQFRYGKEEMLALFSKDLKPPKLNKDVAEFILKDSMHDPLAMKPLTEEEQVCVLVFFVVIV